MGKRHQLDPTVLLPRYVVSEAEWSTVPRTVPDRLLRWGGSLPFLALLFAGFMFAGLGFAVDPALDAFLVFALVLVVLFAMVAGRFAPWVSLLGTGVLLAYGENNAPFSFALWTCFFWFLALGLIAGFTGARLSFLVRHWRGQAAGQVAVDRALLQSTRMQKRANGSAKSVAIALLVLVAAKAVVSFFTDAGRDVRAVAGTVKLDDLEPLFLPILGLGFWLFAALLRLVQERIAGDVVLDIPLDPAIGPLLFQRAIQAVDATEAQRAGCVCGGKKRSKPDGMPPVLDVDDQCPVHGIEAVNALGQREFLAVAAQPWVWGANAVMLPVPPHTRLPIIGLHGWGSRPAVLGTPARVKDSELASHTGYRPWRAAEVSNRTRRKIRWRDRSDISPGLPRTEAEGADVLDRIRLDPAGMPGFATRVAGARPRFEPGSMPQPNRCAPNAEAMRASTP